MLLDWNYQVHRGNLKTMTENARNSTGAGGDRNGNKPHITSTAAREMIIETPQAFVPIKGRIRQMENEEIKLDSLKQSKNEDNHFKKNGNGKTDEIKECDNDSNKQLPQAQVPTPLPRTSRNNSMTDPSSSEESSATGSPRPSPMPRVTIGSGYKVL